MDTRESVVGGFTAAGNLIANIGATIKENDRKRKLAQVLDSFKDPNKIFLNPDGTPKSDAEIAPMINQGVMNLFALGEKDLAGALTTYYGQMSKAYSQDATNHFLYEQAKTDKYFPKKEDEKTPMDYNPRIDYNTAKFSKEFKPSGPKTAFSYRIVNMKGADGSGQIMYMRENKLDSPVQLGDGTVIQPGQVDLLNESEYTKEIRESRQYGKYDFAPGPVQLTLPNGQKFDTEYDPDKGVRYNGKWVPIEDLSKQGIKFDYKTGTGTDVSKTMSPSEQQNMFSKMKQEAAADIFGLIRGTDSKIGENTADRIANELAAYYGTEMFWNKVYDIFKENKIDLEPGSAMHMKLWDIYKKGMSK